MIKYIYKRCKRCDCSVPKEREEDFCEVCQEHVNLENYARIESKLKSCPFCGSFAKYDFLFLGRMHHRIVCPKCFVMTSVCDTVEEAIEIWNHREIKGEEYGKNISNI